MSEVKILASMPVKKMQQNHLFGKQSSNSSKMHGSGVYGCFRKLPLPELQKLNGPMSKLNGSGSG
jgi:hypothetical protein